MPVALVTGGSAGLGRALSHALADNGWTVIVDGRDPDRLAAAADRPGILAVPGDITDTEHRLRLVAAVRLHGHLDLLVHNASTLGPVSGSTPLPALAHVTVDDLQHVWRHNIGAPLVLTTQLLDDLVAGEGILVGISSDAAVEHYPGWGLYGASKAGLDHVVLTFGAENPAITAYAVDPGDMRTQMHADAFPDEDISDRPEPESVVPHLLALLATRPASGRYRAADVPVPAAV
ncbi:SDR family oxidoreductase [Nocardioides marmoriginsengisoli]|uniref:SDR family oxidoreductase n=1 Tax=Nocardioides marmoriginsengisoli TaxID=661483 RepID=A0A3N0CNV2_9ACTN|nr:SDR family oxidoreductase [Nocardioides marmoriginsengisoli]RNL65030.1 SDR family oxidoreductase [Nocardioides marmoriginsengisoli]